MTKQILLMKYDLRGLKLVPKELLHFGVTKCIFGHIRASEKSISTEDKTLCSMNEYRLLEHLIFLAKNNVNLIKTGLNLLISYLTN